MSSFLTEYLSNSLKLSMCLKVIDPAMDAVGRIKGWKAGFCSELKEPVGAPPTTKGTQRNSDLQRYQGDTEHAPL